MEPVLDFARKNKEKKEKKDFDVQMADELARGTRPVSSSHESFLRAVGESRQLAKKEHDDKKKKEDNEFVKKTQKDHEQKVKTELKAILAKKKLALPTTESIFGSLFGKKKKKAGAEEGTEKESKEEQNEFEKEHEKEQEREI